MCLERLALSPFLALSNEGANKQLVMEEVGLCMAILSKKVTQKDMYVMMNSTQNFCML